jgi:hypothetical protein
VLTFLSIFGILMPFQPQDAFLAGSARNKNEVVSTCEIWPLPGFTKGLPAATGFYYMRYLSTK